MRNAARPPRPRRCLPEEPVLCSYASKTSSGGRLMSTSSTATGVIPGHLLSALGLPSWHATVLHRCSPTISVTRRRSLVIGSSGQTATVVLPRPRVQLRLRSARTGKGAGHGGDTFRSDPAMSQSGIQMMKRVVKLTVGPVAVGARYRNNLHRTQKKGRGASPTRERAHGDRAKTITRKIGLLLAMLGILLPHCFPLALVVLTLTALGG